MTTKKQRIKRLVKHLIFKIFTFAIILGIASYVINFPGFTNEMAMALFIISLFLGVTSVITIPIDIGKMFKWLIVPEIKYLEMLKGLMP